MRHRIELLTRESFADILEIVKEENDTKAFGETWHTDQMFNPKPAKATMLYAKETPKFGGDASSEWSSGRSNGGSSSCGMSIFTLLGSIRGPVPL